MLSMKITNVKEFMNKVLREDVFDNFYVCEASLKTNVSYHIDGKINVDYYTNEEKMELNQRKYATWAEEKPLVFQMLKGKKLPVAFKFVFMLSPENVEKIVMQNNLSIAITDIAGLFLNVLYDNGTLTCTTGTSLLTFTLDKTLEYAWESSLMKFFQGKGLEFEEM